MCPFRSIPWTSRVCEVRSTDHAADVTDYRRRIASRKTLVSAAFHRCPSWPCPTAAGELPAHDRSVTSNVADRVRSDAGPAARSRTAGRLGTAGDPRGRAPGRRLAPPTGTSIFSASAARSQPDPYVTAARRSAPAAWHRRLRRPGAAPGLDPANPGRRAPRHRRPQGRGRLVIQRQRQAACRPPTQHCPHAVRSPVRKAARVPDRCALAVWPHPVLDGERCLRASGGGRGRGACRPVG